MNRPILFLFACEILKCPNVSVRLVHSKTGSAFKTMIEELRGTGTMKLGADSILLYKYIRI